MPLRGEVNSLLQIQTAIPSLFHLTKARYVCILDAEGQARKFRAVRMASGKVANLRSPCRFRHTSNEQKDPLEEVSALKTLKYEGRSGDMYEKKEDRCQVPGFRCQGGVA